MFGAELGFKELERLLVERQGQVQLPGSLIRQDVLRLLEPKLGKMSSRTDRHVLEVGPLTTRASSTYWLSFSTSAGG